MATAWKAGLEDVVAARSAITAIDGARGRLYYRGYEIGDLAARIPFEAVTYLLWFGDLPGPDEAAGFAARLRQGWELDEPVRALLERTPRDGHPLDVLRTAVSFAAVLDPDARAVDPAATVRKCTRLMSLVPAVVGAWNRVRSGRPPLPPRADLTHAAQALHAITGEVPTQEAARVIDAILTLHADHEFNASTFALRVAVATVADLHAAIVAAIATLKGPRHGGANEDVLAIDRKSVV